jgi:hypothetical protein
MVDGLAAIVCGLAGIVVCLAALIVAGRGNAAVLRTGFDRSVLGR